VDNIRGTYERLAFPHMRVTPLTYPDLTSHAGCYRCHGVMVGTTGAVKGQLVGAECEDCHYSAPPDLGTTVETPPANGAPAEPQPAATPSGPSPIPHPVQGREQCTTCHTVGGPGVGEAGGLGMPADHAGRTDATCLGCHR
jgi:hypothetical protein